MGFTGIGHSEEIVADGPPALHALRNAIDVAQAGSPLTPVTVVVPSNSVGVAARRWRPTAASPQRSSSPRIAWPSCSARRRSWLPVDAR
jgi:hypothetical protein